MILYLYLELLRIPMNNPWNSNSLHYDSHYKTPYKNLEIFTNAKDEIMEAVNNELFETFREFFPEKLEKNIICRI